MLILRARNSKNPSKIPTLKTQASKTFQALIPQSQAMEVVVASSSIDGGIGCWDIHTGAEQLRYKTCVSPPHGLACVGQRFLASSQVRDPSANSGCILYWSWSKVRFASNYAHNLFDDMPQ